MIDETEPTIENAVTEESAEEATTSPAVSEEQLLELAQKEGLADGLESGSDETPEALEASAKAVAELTDEQRAQTKAAIETILFMSDRP
ncbi:MAG TPA: hypothetical protein PLH57_09320, partial [Oligoflexia bacterium]|nr:hypothetical protein [Oligoflexia bacterium]